MRQQYLVAAVFAAALLIQTLLVEPIKADDEGIADLASVKIELERLVHFSGPKGESVQLQAGQYEVERRDAELLAFKSEDSETYLVTALKSEHEEALPGAQALSLPIDEDSYIVLLLQTDGSSLEARGTYTGVVTRDAVAPVDADNVSAAYQDWLGKTDVETRGVALQPQAYDPRPKVAMTWQQQMELRMAGKITSQLLRKAVEKTFAGATVSANACGGSYVYRKTVVNIPSAPFYEEYGLQRLHHDFTNGEREASQYTFKQRLRNGRTVERRARRYSLRACVDGWSVTGWYGLVANGLIEVHMSFGASDIATRALDYRKTDVGWKKRWEWRDQAARDSTKDHLLYPVLIATLRPAVSGGRVTLDVANVRWDNRRNMWSDEGRFRVVPREADLIRGYKLSTFNVLLSRYSAIFNNSSVRNQLSNHITAALLANSYVNKITGIEGPSNDGTAIALTYQ